MTNVLSSNYLAVKPTTLPRSYFKFPPSSTPAALPPPANRPTFAHPFTIPPDVYNALLEPSVPITIALVYVSIVSYFNTVNIKSKQPWAISQTSYFKPLVILHNAFLALYSAWTLVGMINALYLSVPGIRGEYGLAGVVDGLCKINGPRGIGNAAFYNETSSAWTITNKAFHLAADGLAPEPTDVGRIWNEGLAFYGWLFYLSKFYEVIDTFIILAKGRKSSFLQTYHHAGAMLCMWAGIRYASPPIWMFVLVNSGIHSIMYTFYLCTAVGIKINKRIKQSLTTLQITQFVVGTVYAFSHLFVAYQIPVSIPYLHRLGTAVSSVVAAIPTEASSVSAAVVASASAGAGAWLKKAVLRAAGREGLAENVLNDRGQTFGVDAVHIIEDIVAREETRFRNELQWTHCLNTSGQVFAILLNCLYLAPLTGLFVRFFIKAYLRQMERRRSSVHDTAIKSFRDASKGFSRQVGDMHSSDGKDPEPSEQLDKAAEKLISATGKLNDSFDPARLNEEFSNGMKQLKQSLRDKQAEKVQETPSKMPSGMTRSDLVETAKEVKTTVADTAFEAKNTIADSLSDNVTSHIGDKAADVMETAKQTADSVAEKSSNLGQVAYDSIPSDKIEDTAASTEHKFPKTDTDALSESRDNGAQPDETEESANSPKDGAEGEVEVGTQQEQAPVQKECEEPPEITPESGDPPEDQREIEIHVAAVPEKKQDALEEEPEIPALGAETSEERSETAQDKNGSRPESMPISQKPESANEEDEEHSLESETEPSRSKPSASKPERELEADDLLKSETTETELTSSEAPGKRIPKDDLKDEESEEVSSRDKASAAESLTVEPAQEEPAKEEPGKEEPAKEEPAKEKLTKEEPAKDDIPRGKHSIEDVPKEDAAKDMVSTEDPSEDKIVDNQVTVDHKPVDEHSNDSHTTEHSNGNEHSHLETEPTSLPEAGPSGEQLESDDANVEGKNESGTGEEEEIDALEATNEDKASGQSIEQTEKSSVQESATVEDSAGAFSEENLNRETTAEVEQPKLEVSKLNSSKSSTPKPPSIQLVAKSEDTENLHPDTEARAVSSAENHELKDAALEDSSAEVKEGTTFADAVKA